MEKNKGKIGKKDDETLQKKKDRDAEIMREKQRQAEEKKKAGNGNSK